jgi:TPR repeat protein/serine/threonine protein kinase
MNQEFKVGQFVLERPLGEGGMAEVWLGRNPHIGTTAAIKFLNRRFASNQDVEARFLNEGRRQGSLDHPNIIKVYGFEYVGSQGFLILQYIDGIPLDLRLQHGRMNDEEILRVASGILGALGCAHAAGIVHRDVKPSNILLDRRGVPYLGDFGIVRAMGEASRTRTTSRMGTLYYMSPEQIQRPKEVDHRADIYGFGCVLYEMLTGRVPFGTDSDRDSSDFMVELAHVRTPPPGPRSLNAAIRPAVEQVVLRCLEKEPEQRYSTCEELRDALVRAMTGTVVEPLPEKRSHPKTVVESVRPGIAPGPYQKAEPPKPSTRSRAQLWSIVAVATLVLVVAGVAIWNSRQRTEKASQFASQGLMKFNAQDYRGATDDFRQAADAGNTVGMFYLGRLYANGWGVSRDYNEAMRWFRKASDAGDAASTGKVGVLYANGWGVSPDYAEAMKWLRKGADGGDGRSMTGIGSLYAIGHGVSVDNAEAMKWYRKGADAGDGAGMDGLGDFYRLGMGVPVDYAEAMRWYLKGADAGDGPSMANLGDLYRWGNGVAVNYAEAMKWYRKGSEVGNADSMTSVGELYDAGEGVKEDTAQARDWYEKAVEAGGDEAMADLGNMHEFGDGEVKQDYLQAKSWFEKAAAAGNVRGMLHLGELFHGGKGVEENDVQARQWYEKAAAAGNVGAMFELGNFSAFGEGGSPKDQTQAREWYRKADANYNVDQNGYFHASLEFLDGNFKRAWKATNEPGN